MQRAVPVAHPLRRLFAAVTERSFLEGLGWPDLEVIRYLTELLVDFTHIDNLTKIRNAQGRPLDEVVEMLAEGDLVDRPTSLERQRHLHKHIGDYTLFMTGLFPEFLRRMKRPRIVISPDAFLDYVETGKRSYRVASQCSIVATPEEALLFRKLAENFELCVYGLGHIRVELTCLRNRTLQRIWGTLLS